MPHRNNPVLAKLLDGNKSFATRFRETEPALLKQLATGQHPKIFWLGCSDSRVPESVICNAKPGDLFVHRNIANSFKVDDGSSLAALAYGIAHLGIEHVIVCGHYGCGGIAAAMDSAQSHLPVHTHKDEGEEAIAKWLSPIRGLAVAQRRSPITQKLDSESALALLVESHVSATVSNISQSSVIQSAWKRGIPVSIHGWVYHVDSGRLTDLGVEEGVFDEEEVATSTLITLGTNGIRSKGFAPESNGAGAYQATGVALAA